MALYIQAKLVAVCLVCTRSLFTGVLLLCLASFATASAELPTPEPLDVSVAMEHLEPLWESMHSDIASCGAKMRIFFQVPPKSSLTPAQLHEMFRRHNVGDHIENAELFLQEYAGQGAWQSPLIRQHYEQGIQLRHDMGTQSHIDTDSFSFVVDGDLQQIHVFERGRTTSAPATLKHFRFPLKSRAEGYLPTHAERIGSAVKLVAEIPPNGPVGKLTSTNFVDWSTGIPLRREQMVNSDLIQESLYTGLTTFAGGMTSPRCVLTVRYTQGGVQSVDLALLQDAVFNESIPEQVFRVAKPSNWHVLDFRNQLGGVAIPLGSESAEDVTHLITSAPALSGLSPVTQRSLQEAPMPSPMRILLILNGIILIGAGVWMWRRSSLVESKN